MKGVNPSTHAVHLVESRGGLLVQRCPSRASNTPLHEVPEDTALTCKPCIKLDAKENPPQKVPSPRKRAPRKEQMKGTAVAVLDRPVTATQGRRCQSCLSTQECVFLPSNRVWVCLDAAGCVERADRLT